MEFWLYPLIMINVKQTKNDKLMLLVNNRIALISWM